LTATGFTLFKIDPGDHVEASADALDEAALRARYALFPWFDLESSPGGLLDRYMGKRFGPDNLRITLNEEALMRAAIKYGRAVAQVVVIYRRRTCPRSAAPEDGRDKLSRSAENRGERCSGSLPPHLRRRQAVL
jgi:hypothetical protein